MSINKRYSDVVSPATNKSLFNSDLLPPEIHVKVKPRGFKCFFTIPFIKKIKATNGTMKLVSIVNYTRTQSIVDGNKKILDL